MPTANEISNDSFIILTRASAGSSSKWATIAFVCSVLIHGGILSACVYFSQDLFLLTNVRLGQAAVPAQLTLTASQPDAPRPIRFQLQRPRFGVAAVDRVSEELAQDRGIELVRRSNDHNFTPLLDPLDIRPVVLTPEVTRNQQRAESPDDLRPSTMRSVKRPRRYIEHPLAVSTPPSLSDVGTRSWIPRPLASNIPPNYPVDAIKSRIEGTTLLRVTVTKEGTVAEVEIKHSSGSSILDQAAANAVESWRFHRQDPSLTVKTQSVLLPIEFSLDR